MNGQPWSAEENRRLADLRHAGMTMAEIAEEMGRPYEATRSHARSIGLSEVRGASIGWSDERVEWLKRLWADGATCSEIANEMGGGLTRNGVIGKVTRLGLPRRGKAGVGGRPVRTQAAPKSAPRPIFKKTVMTPVQVKTKTGTSFHRMVEKVVTAQEMPDLELIAAPDPSLHVSIMDLRQHHCRWPIGDPGNIETFRYCGADSDLEDAYCKHHARIAYVPAAARREHSEETKEKIRLAALRRRQSGQSWAGV